MIQQLLNLLTPQPGTARGPSMTARQTSESLTLEDVDNLLQIVTFLASGTPSKPDLRKLERIAMVMEEKAIQMGQQEMPNEDEAEAWNNIELSSIRLSKALLRKRTEQQSVSTSLARTLKELEQEKKTFESLQTEFMTLQTSLGEMQRRRVHSVQVTSVTNLPFSTSNLSAVRLEDNYIHHHGGRSIQSVILGQQLSTVCIRIHYSLFLILSLSISISISISIYLSIYIYLYIYLSLPSVLTHSLPLLPSFMSSDYVGSIQNVCFSYPSSLILHSPHYSTFKIVNRESRLSTHSIYLTYSTSIISLH